MENTIHLERSVINDLPVILIRFKYNSKIISRLKYSGIAKWSPAMRAWYIFERNFDEEIFREQFSSLATVSQGIVLDTKLSNSELLRAGIYKLPEDTLIS